MADNLDEFQPSGFGVDVDLAAFEKQQAADIARKDKLAEAEVRLKREQAWEKDRKRDRHVRKAKTALIILLILGVLTAGVLGCIKWYGYEYKKNAAMWLAWMSQCDQAGGKPVGERFNLICSFPDSELPYGRGGSLETWDKKYGPAWVDNCSRSGGRPAGIEEYTICVFPSGAQLPYGEYGLN